MGEGTHSRRGRMVMTTRLAPQGLFGSAHFARLMSALLFLAMLLPAAQIGRVAGELIGSLVENVQACLATTLVPTDAEREVHRRFDVVVRLPDAVREPESAQLFEPCPLGLSGRS